MQKELIWGLCIISDEDNWDELIQKICGFLEKEELSDDRNDPYDINDPYDDHITLVPLNKEIEDSKLDDLIEMVTEDHSSHGIIERSNKTALRIESINNKGPCLKVYLAPYAHNLFPKD